MKSLQKFFFLVPPAFFLLAAYLVHQELKHQPMGEISAAISSIPGSLFVVAIGLTILNYLVLCLYDGLALHYAKQKVSALRILMASFISYAISNNTGHALISGTSVRYRFYTAWGVPGWEVLKISFFLAITFLVGACTLEVVTVLLLPASFYEQAHIPHNLIFIVTALCAVSLLAYWGSVLFIRKPINIRGARFELPSPGISLLQTMISAFDLALSGVVLYLFLKHQIDVPFHDFLAIYIIALLAGLASQVPGGLGVFESVFMLLLGDQYAATDIFASLIVYRTVYYFFPLLLAGVGLFVYEARLHRQKISKGGEQIRKILDFIIPPVYALLILLTSAMLLVADAAPPFVDNIKWMNSFLPLTLIEFSHLLSGLVGLCLLFVARGILLRLDAAYYAVLILLAIGAMAAVFKGLDWTEAGILSLMLILFLPTHGYFRRPSSLLSMSLPVGWIVMIALTLGGMAWVGFYSYRHIPYAHDLWWDFHTNADAARFMRALALVITASTAFALYRLLRIARHPQEPQPQISDQETLRLVAGSNDTLGYLAFLRDKKFIWHESGKAFIMYADTSKYWIAMGDPIGDPGCFSDLLWTFRERAHHYGAKVVFYETSDKYLPLYLDLGLILLKIGEKARVFLPDFSMEGGKREKQRKAQRNLSNAGYNVRILNPEELEQALPALRVVSDDWLSGKKAHEKGFSLGFFDEEYLRVTKVAVVEKDGVIVAFANLWILDNKDEIMIDLMRYSSSAPNGIIEYLFIALILWAKENGYRWFNLGMAPLSGLETHPLAPLWHKIGTLIFRHGEEFYNFEGLHAYKSKFSPVWTPHYIAVPPGPHVPVILVRIAALIAGNIKGIFRKS